MTALCREKVSCSSGMPTHFSKAQKISHFTLVPWPRCLALRNLLSHGPTCIFPLLALLKPPPPPWGGLESPWALFPPGVGTLDFLSSLVSWARSPAPFPPWADLL